MAVGVKVDDANFQLILKRMQERDLAALDDSQRENLATLMDVADSLAAASVSTPPKEQKRVAQKPAQPTKKSAPLPAPSIPEDLLSNLSQDSGNPIVTTSQQKRKPRAAPGTVKVTVVQDHTTESGLLNTASAIVTSVTHLETETKTGLAAVADTIKNVFGSLKGALGGGGPTGVGGPPPPSGGAVFVWPNGPWTNPQEHDRQTRQGIYTAEADKHIQYRDSWVDQRKQEWLTVGGLANKMFDKNGLIGGMVHRKLEQNRDEKSYAELQAVFARTRGETPKPAKEYRNQFREVNPLRKQAAEQAAQLDRYEAEGWDEEVIKKTDAYDRLDKINQAIFKKDPAAKAQYEKWLKNRNRGNSGESSSSSGGGSERAQWEAHANATGESDTAQAARPNYTTQPSKESEEEARKDREDLLAVIEKVVTNTEPIKDIADFLGVKKDDSKDDKRKGGADPKEKGFFGKTKDFIGGVVSDYRAGGARKVLERVSGLGGGTVGRVATTVAGAGSRAVGAITTGAALASPYARAAGGAAVRGAGTLAMGAGRLAVGALSLAVANPLAAGVAVAGMGAAFGAYKAYQWWNGDDSGASQVDSGLGPKGKRGRKVAPERFDNREDYINAFEKKNNWFPDDISSRNDARSEANMTWQAKKGYTPYEKEMQQRAVEMMKPKPISSTTAAPVLNTLNHVDNSSKSYITMESKAVDTDPSLGRQREARWT